MGMAEMTREWRDFIHRDPEVLAGKPVLKGTRLSVEFILGLFAPVGTRSTYQLTTRASTRKKYRPYSPSPLSAFETSQCTRYHAVNS